MSVFPTAGEAILSGAGRLGQAAAARGGRSVPPAVAGDAGRDDRTAANAERAYRRARGRLRRYVTANRLTVMCTLTCGDQIADRGLMLGRVGRFMRRVRLVYGAGPYAVVLERHRSGALHAHLAWQGRRRHGVVSRLWGHGYVWLSQPPKPARYLAKYLGKDMAPLGGGHRYEVGQGFAPEVVQVAAADLEGAWRAAVGLMGGEVPAYSWWSAGEPDWRGPPVGFLSWT